MTSLLDMLYVSSGTADQRKLRSECGLADRRGLPFEYWQVRELLGFVAQDRLRQRDVGGAAADACASTFGQVAGHLIDYAAAAQAVHYQFSLAGWRIY